MRYFEARDLRDAATLVTLVSAVLGIGIFLVDYLPDEKLSQLGFMTTSLTLIIASVALAVRANESSQMADHESDLAVGGTD